MSRSLVVVIVLLAASKVFAGPHGNGNGNGFNGNGNPHHNGPQPDAVVSREKMGHKLTRVNDMLTTSIGHMPSKQLQDELRQIRQEVDELRELMASAPDYYQPQQPVVVVQQQQQPNLPPPPPNPVMPPPGQVQIQVAPMAPQDLGQLIAAINREGFSDGKLRVLQSAASNSFFLVDQVKQVLNAFPFSKDKLTAVSMMAPHILNTANSFQLYDSFVMSGDKAQLKQILDTKLPHR